MSTCHPSERLVILAPALVQLGLTDGFLTRTTNQPTIQNELM
jgi:hypothetical protein